MNFEKLAVEIGFEKEEYIKAQEKYNKELFENDSSNIFDKMLPDMEKNLHTNEVVAISPSKQLTSEELRLVRLAYYDKKK